MLERFRCTRLQALYRANYALLLLVSGTWIFAGELAAKLGLAKRKPFFEGLLGLPSDIWLLLFFASVIGAAAYLNLLLAANHSSKNESHL